MNDFIIIGTFSVFLIVFTAIGALSARHKLSTAEDYLVASRNINPWLTALSAVSTNNSGYMFIGLIGFTWRQGVEAVWITFGWIVGDLLSWLWVHKRVRRQSEEVHATSVPALLARDLHGGLQRPIAVAAGILTFLFLGGYAAAQLKAGSSTLHALFGWPMWLGSVLGVVVVAIYCMSGGIRASIWTDAAQSIVMVVAMSILLAVCVDEVGGASALFDALGKIDPDLIDVFPHGLAFGLGLYVLGFVFGGIATVGQPHILIRFMAIDATESLKKARTIYFTWYTFFSFAALAVGLYARVLLPDLAAGLSPDETVTATETALPTLTVAMLPAILIGVMLAGLFSATMSTADSQILSCSAAITQDVMPRWQNSYLASKIATLAVAAMALLIALSASSGAFSIVLIAWSALGASLGPVLIVRLSGWPLPSALAIAMMSAGLGTVMAWGTSAWADSVFKVLPGMLAAFAVYGVGALVLRYGPARVAVAVSAMGPRPIKDAARAAQSEQGVRS